MKIARNLIAAFLITIAATCLAATVRSQESPEEHPSGPLRIMTFNLRYAAANDGQPWEKRRPVMKELILQAKPDVIGTQEGLYRQLTDLEADLPGYGWIGVGREGGQLGEFMAVFYNKNRVKPLEHHHFWLSDTPDVIASTGWGNKIPRMVTWVRFQDLLTNKTFYLANTHFDHQSEVSRQNSAQLIIEAMEEFHPDIPIFLTGDFNTHPGGAAYRILTEDGDFHDAFFDAKKRINDDIGTYHNYGDPTGGGPARRLDWILYRGKVNVLRGETVTFNADGQYPSDHFPVMVDAILQKASRVTGETVLKKQAKPALLLTEVVPNSYEKGNFNFVEIYNNTDKAIDLEGYQIYYYYDPLLPFEKAKSNKWVITKDQYSTSTVILPKETKVIWVKKQPCCYDLGMDAFLQNYGLTGQDLLPERLLAVFTPGQNQGMNGTSDTGRALSIISPDGVHLVGAQYNKGVLEVQANESIAYSAPDPFSSVMRKLAGNQRPTPGKLIGGQLP